MTASAEMRGGGLTVRGPFPCGHAGADRDGESAGHERRQRQPAARPRRGWRGSGFDLFASAGHRGDEAVALARQRLDESWLFRRIAERFPQMVDDLVQAAIEVDEGAGRPQASGQLFARDQLARPFEQRQQELVRLIAEGRSTARVRQLARPSIDGEALEVVDTRGPDAVGHRLHPAQRNRESIIHRCDALLLRYPQKAFTAGAKAPSIQSVRSPGMGRVGAPSRRRPTKHRTKALTRAIFVLHFASVDRLQDTRGTAVINDIRLALRTLPRIPGFSLAFILTLGLGIGANTAIFSVINGVLLRPLPYPEADRIVHLRQPQVAAGVEDTSFSFAGGRGLPRAVEDARPVHRIRRLDVQRARARRAASRHGRAGDAQLLSADRRAAASRTDARCRLTRARPLSRSRC